MKEWKKEEVIYWISSIFLKMSNEIPSDLSNIIQTKSISGEVLYSMTLDELKTELKTELKFPFGILKILNSEIERYKREEEKSIRIQEEEIIGMYKRENSRKFEEKAIRIQEDEIIGMYKREKSRKEFEKAIIEAEEKVRREFENARIEAEEEKARREFENARREAEEKDRREFEEKIREAEEKVKLEEKFKLSKEKENTERWGYNEKNPVGSITRFIAGEDIDNCEHKNPLAPFVLLTKNENPLPFEKCILNVYKEELEEIFLKSYIIFGENIYGKLSNPENTYGLTRDEALSLYFYTLQWNQNSLYSRLNIDLASNQRMQLVQKWKFYLYHLFNALTKIPIWKPIQDLYRGVSSNIVKLFPQKYIVGNKISWYGFISTTTQLNVIKSFLGHSECTIFCINGCISGRHIQKFSASPSECEVLIPAGSQFEIISIIEIGTVTMVQLKQIPLELLQL
jgi:hypothetical protein